MDWRLCLPTSSGLFLTRDWRDGMGGGGTHDGAELFSSWAEREDDPALYAEGILLHCPLPAGTEE